MSKLFYQGHGSLRFRTNNNTVIYLDPYAGEGYDLEADLVLVTHQHGDHNKTDLVTLKDDGVIYTQDMFLENGQYLTKEFKDVKITATQAYNKNHPIDQCVGYILEFDGLKVYCAGDTSTTKQMAELSKLELDYAFLSIDGIYNMGPDEASECAKMIQAKHTVPIHMKPGELFDEKQAEKLVGQNITIVYPGKEVNI